MAKKKIYKLHQYQDGLINDPSAKDIPDSACQYTAGTDFGSLGKLKMGGKFVGLYDSNNLVEVDGFGGTGQGFDRPNLGAGFYYFGSDEDGFAGHLTNIGEGECYVWLVSTQEGNIWASWTRPEFPFSVQITGDGFPEGGSQYWEKIFEFEEDELDKEYQEDEYKYDSDGNLIYPIWHFVNVNDSVRAFDINANYDPIFIGRSKIDMKSRFKDDLDSLPGFNVSLGDPKWIVHRTQAGWEDTNHPETYNGNPPIREHFTPTVRDMWGYFSGVDFDSSGSSDDTADLYFAEHRWHGNNVIKLVDPNRFSSPFNHIRHVLQIPKCAKETVVFLTASSTGSGTWPTHDPNDDGAIQFYFSLVYEDGSETPEIIGDRHSLEQNTGIVDVSSTEDDANDGWIDEDLSYENVKLNFAIMVGLGAEATEDAKSSFTRDIPTSINLNHGGTAGSPQTLSCPTTIGSGNKYSTSDYMSRIVGFRMYWNHSEEEPNERWLLLDVNYEKGIRLPGRLTYDDWKRRSAARISYDWITDGYTGITQGYLNPGNGVSDADEDLWPMILGNSGGRNDAISQITPLSINISFKDPPRIERFEDINGYSRSEGLSKVKYGTAVLVHNRLYVGRVNVDGKLYSDRIMRSAPGQFDVFPSESFVDLQESDGDAIIHLYLQIFQF